MNDFINSTVNTKIYNLMSDEHQIITITDKQAVVENIGTIVSGDTNSCLLTFEINRFQDGIDLSDKKIRFNYRNSNGKFYDVAVNVKYNDDVIRFSWLLPYSLTQPGGNVIASIEFYGYIEYDEEYSYKTKNFKLSVEKSLGVNDEFDKSYSNWTIRIENDVETIQKKISEIEKEIKSIHVPTKLSEMDDDTEHRTVSDSQIDTWNEAHKNSQADWNEENTNSSAYIKNKPQIQNVTNDLTDELKSSYDEAVDKKHTHSNMSVLDGITYENIESWNNKSEFDGQYSSLQGIPDDIATETYVDEKVKNKVNESDLATVAKTGLYNDLKDKPDSLPASDVYQWAKQSQKPSYTADEVGALPKDTKIPSKTSDLQDDIGFLERPNTAKVGQVISVKSVDETGRPIEYEAVNMLEGEIIDVDAELKSYFKELKPTVISTINAKGGYATTTDSFTKLCTTGIESIPNGIVATETLPRQTVLTTTYSALSPDGITLNYEDVGAYGYLIVRKENNKPTTTADGTIVYKGSYQSGLVDKDVTLEQTYYYRIFPYNSKNQYQSLEGQSVSICDYKSRSDQKQVKDLVLDDTIAFGYFSNQVFTWKVVDTQSDNGAIFAADQNCGNLVWDQPENATDNPNPITNRKNQGNNRWAYSNIRQWLNSDAVAGEWYTPQHEYDVAPSYKTWNGFLNLFTDAEKDAIVLRTNTCILDKNDGGGTETVQDKIWFPSSYETGKEVTKEGYKFEKYDGTNASTAYQNNWWLRTINNPTGSADTASNVRFVGSGGSVGGYNASNGYSVRPFCQLKSDTWLTWSDTLAAYVLADDSQRAWAA